LRQANLKTKRSLQTEIVYASHRYPVVLTWKRMKRITFRMRGHTIFISSPLKLELTYLLPLLEKMMPRLLARYPVLPEKPGFLRLFGTWIPWENDAEAGPHYVKQRLRAWALPRLAYWMKQLHLEHHPMPRLTIRDMHTRWGTYARRTHRITLALKLAHYEPEVIDAVLAHECVHMIHFDHSPRFYGTLHRIMPQYRMWHDKLKQGFPNGEHDHF
jgi:predicted metal-dependent hydrolase